MKRKHALIIIFALASIGWTQAGGEGVHPWWSDRSAGLVGGWGGAIFGCLGGLIGTLNSLGKGRAFIIAVMKVQVALGAACAVAGIVAVAQHQPYGVYYPLLLLGILLTTINASLLPTVRKRFQELELRRMQSLDATGHST